MTHKYNKSLQNQREFDIRNHVLHARIVSLIFLSDKFPLCPLFLFYPEGPEYAKLASPVKIHIVTLQMLPNTFHYGFVKCSATCTVLFLAVECQLCSHMISVLQFSIHPSHHPQDRYYDNWMQMHFHLGFFCFLCVFTESLDSCVRSQLSCHTLMRIRRASFPRT